MARRRRSRKRGKSKQSIAVLPVMCALAPALQTYSAAGAIWYPGAEKDYLYNYTGYAEGQKLNMSKAMGVLGLQIVGIVGHKIANRTVNRYIKKATFGYLVL